MADKQLVPQTYASWKRAVFAVVDFLISSCGYFVPAPNAKTGDWTGALGDNLQNGDGIVLETPSTGPFRQQMLLGIVALANQVPYLSVRHAPWVGVSGGWNQGAGTFDEPESGEERLYFSAGTPLKATVIANDRRFVVLAWWTPATINQADIQFVALNSEIHRGTGSFVTDGYIRGALFTGSGTTSNNQMFEAASVAATSISTYGSPTAVNEGPGAAILTPRPVGVWLYAGAIDPLHVGDARPAALRASIWGSGVEGVLEGARPQQSGFGAMTGWRRIHADTSGGYVKLTNGFWMPLGSLSGGVPEVLIDQPSWDGAYSPLSILLCWDETVGQPRKELPAGSLDGVFVTALRKYLYPLGASNELMLRDGLAVVWPSGSTAV